MLLEKPGWDRVSGAADGRGLEQVQGSKPRQDEHPVPALRRRAEAQQPGASLQLPVVISQGKAGPNEAVSPSPPLLRQAAPLTLACSSSALFWHETFHSSMAVDRREGDVFLMVAEIKNKAGFPSLCFPSCVLACLGRQ